MDLHIFWFVVIGILLAGYAFLDGFDLGVGIVFYTAKTDDERRLFMNSIGPIWDGNEVWLVTFGVSSLRRFPRSVCHFFFRFLHAVYALTRGSRFSCRVAGVQEQG